MLVLAVAVLMLAGRAGPPGPCPPGAPYVDQVFPVSGASGLPANTVVRVEPNIRDGSLFVMVTVTSGLGGYSGAAVVAEGDVYVFDPGVDLAPATWTARIVLDDGDVDPVTSSITFTTVTGTDTTAPEIPFAPELDVGDYFDAGPVPGCPDPPPVWIVSADWDDATDASPIIYATRGRLLENSTVTIGGTPDATFQFEVFAIDVAGNAGAAPIASVDLPGEPSAGDPGVGCSCSMPSRGASRPGVALFGLGGLVLAWRRRQARASR